MLMTPKDWLDMRFGNSPRRPHPSSVRRWIDNGDLPGERIGGRYFVEYDPSFTPTGDDVVDRILKNDPKAA